ncbi:MAG TPA: hypothetical protein VFB81_04125, partial [Myxococcales bacterium]|nr:hypothetical protein [Myxococcales bacterium]
YTCGDTACKTSCQADADCGAGLRCVEGACWTDRELEDARLAKLGGFIAKGDGFGCSAVPSDASVLYLALTVAAVLLWRYRGAPARIRKR